MTNMSNMWTVIILVFFMVSVSHMANELNITTIHSEDIISTPDTPEQPDTDGGGFFGGLADGITAVFTWSFETGAAFFQLMTFNVDMPTLLNTVIITPMVFGLLYLVLIMVRGGAS